MLRGLTGIDSSWSAQALPQVVAQARAAHEREPNETVNYYPLLIKDWIDENYDYIGRFYYADLYQLRDEGGGG